MIKSLLSFLVTLLLVLPAQSQDVNKAKAIELYEKGETALANKEYFKAQAHYNECLRLYPRYAEAYRSRGIARELLGEKAKALTDYNIYVDLRPEDSEGLFSRAVLRFDSKQYLLARQDFLKLLSMPVSKETNTVYYSVEKHGNSDPKIQTAQTGGKDHIYNYLGQIETQLERYPVAINWLDSAILKAPFVPGYWINRGVAQMARGDKAGATADFEEALKLDPNNSLAIHNLATVKSISGEGESAEKLLSEAIEKNDKLPYPRAERAYQRLQKNDLVGALEDYNEVIKLDPKEAENFINRGLVKERMKDHDDALDDFSQAIKLDDKDPKAWACHGNVLSKLGRWKEAVEDYTVALSHDPKYGHALFNRGIAHQNTGNKSAACADLKAALKLGVKEAERLMPRICK